MTKAIRALLEKARDTKLEKGSKSMTCKYSTWNEKQQFEFAHVNYLIDEHHLDTTLPDGKVIEVKLEIWVSNGKEAE